MFNHYLNIAAVKGSDFFLTLMIHNVSDKQKGAKGMKVDIKLIEQQRQKKGYSREYVAEYLNYKTVGAYTHKVNGRRAFNLNDLIKLSELYNLEIANLIK